VSDHGWKNPDPVIPMTKDHMAYKLGPAPNPDPRCPKCGYTMCELFDYQAVTPLAFSATPTGKYQCYHCTPVGP
jgi:transposase-like protein